VTKETKKTAPEEKTPPEEKSLTLNIVPSREPKLGRVYSNYVQVKHTQYEFTILFGDLTPPSSEDLVKLKDKGKITIPNIVEIVVVPNLIPAIIGALKEDYTKFLKQSEDVIKEEKGTEVH
jgi:hypothetical protein